MSKVFNTTAVCIPEEHYMVDIVQRLQEIKALVDDGKYFTINKARQYGKTTTLIELKRLLEAEYYVVLMDFQTFGSADFANENVFALSFCHSFLPNYGIFLLSGYRHFPSILLTTYDVLLHVY